VTGHLLIHWPVVTEGNASACRGDDFDAIALMFRNEVALTWERHCRLAGVDGGRGLARVVAIIDIAPDSFGSPERVKERFA